MNAGEPDPRLGPRAKIERAKVHLAEFDRQVNAFLAGNPYKFRVHVDPDGTQHVILESAEPIPLAWGAIVGDVIHNARSALDLLATCSGRLETNTRKRFGFPIFRDKSEFESKAFNNFGKDCPQTVRFLRRLKPYERLIDRDRPNADIGHHANTLVLLNRLSNRDKHELITPVGTAAGRAIVTPEPGFGEPFEIRPPSAPLLEQGEIIISISPTDPLFAGKKFNTQVTGAICLGGIEGLPFVGASALLHHIVKIVDRIILIAERRLFK